MRLLFDTNVLVSGLLFRQGPPAQLVKAWRSGAFELVMSDFVMDELVRIGARLAPRLKVTTQDVANFVDTVALRAEWLEIDAQLLSRVIGVALRDPDDCRPSPCSSAPLPITW